MSTAQPRPVDLVSHCDRKIFCIGYSKTGTTSLSRALTLLGLRTFRSGLDGKLPPQGEFDAATHEYIANHFEKLDRDYPNSRFIVTMRDREDWLGSAVPYYRGMNVEKSEEQLLGEFDAHYARVHRYFADRPDDVLFLDVIDSPGWQALCAFLELPVPAIGFPHENKLDDVVGRRNRKRLFRMIRPFVPSFARGYVKKLFRIAPLSPDGFTGNGADSSR